MNRVAVIQSNYIPWKGYFDIIHDADTFVFYDDVQFTKNDWRNRNRIQTPTGVQWLSIPVGRGLHRRICDVKLTDPKWQNHHWKVLEQNYQKALHYSAYREFFASVYLRERWASLSELNQHLIRSIATDLLGIRVRWLDSRDFPLSGVKEGRLLTLLKEIGAKTYITGPSARQYLNERSFAEADIAIEYKDYSGYPEYSQIHQPFEHAVSIVDLLFNCGKEASNLIWGWRENNGLLT